MSESITPITPIYKKLYRYICDTCSGYKKTLAEYINNSAEYLRLKIREHPICKGDQPVSRELLERLFKVPITKENKQKYRKKFLKKCKELMEMLEDENHVAFTFNTLYSIVPREEILPSNLPLEMFINLVAFCISMGISWSDYLLAYPSGQKMITDLFLSPKKSIAIANMLMIIKSVYVMGGNEILFKKEMFTLLPNIQEFVKGTIFEKNFVLWVSNQISSKVFLAAIEK